MKMKNVVVAIGCMLGSCTAYHSGVMTGGMPAPSKHSKVVDLAIGTAKAHYFCGLGSVNESGLVLQAKRELYIGYPLKPMQIYSNISVDTKRAFYLFYWNTKVTVSADIVDYDSVRTQNINFPVKTKGNVAVGDSVFVPFAMKSYDNVTIAKLLNIKNNMAKIGFWIQDRYVTKNCNIKKIFPMNYKIGCDAKSKYKLGSQVSFTTIYFGSQIQENLVGKVINVLENKYLVEVDRSGEKEYYVLYENGIK